MGGGTFSFDSYEQSPGDMERHTKLEVSCQEWKKDAVDGHIYTNGEVNKRKYFLN